MTLATTNNRKDYVGDNSQTVFPYDFLVLDETHFEIYLNGVLQALTTDYTVSGVLDESGGDITFVTAPGNGVAVLVLRVVPSTQTVDLPNTGSFPSTTVEQQGLDKQVMLVQQLEEETGRAIKLPKESLLTDIDFPIPGAGNYLRWNAGGDALEAVSAVNDSGSFLASGAGAVSRSVTSKLGDILSVKDFGVTGDGVTDDTDNIQACFDAAEASNAIVLFPPSATNYIQHGTLYYGNISISGYGATLEIKNDATFRQLGTGAHKNNNALVSKSSPDVGYGIATVEFHMEGLTIYFKRTSATGTSVKTALNLSNISRGSVDHCRLYADQAGDNFTTVLLDFYQQFTKI